MTNPCKQMTADELRNAWSIKSDTAATVDREEALWEYWRRVSTGEILFQWNELEAAFDTKLHGLGNAVGELARQNILPPEKYLSIRARLSKTQADWEFALNQLNAREALEALKAEAREARGVLIEALLAKGVAWAACLAMPYLSHSEQRYLVAAVEERKVFTRGQRHDVRAACAQAETR